MRDVLSGLVSALAAAVLSAGLAVAARAQGAAAPSGQCGPNAIGLARTVEVDTTGGPRFGAGHFPASPPLQHGEIVLTFDDGPHKIYTQRILDALAAHCTKATFLMTGQRILYYPAIAQQVARAGHTVGTHTWSHQNLARISRDAAKAELEMAVSAAHKVLGSQAAPFFRFPYLSEPKDIVAHLRARNIANIAIDIDSRDFRTRSPTLVIRNVMRDLAVKGKGIILFHDIQPSTAGAIKTLLDELKVQGYHVVHLVPRQAVTTVADYDRRIDHDFANRRLAALPVPIGQRGIVSPAWEVRVYRGGASGGYSASADTRSPRAAGADPAPSVASRAAPARPSDDWLSGIFRGW
jgi:peptidoglycan/xylan/chitin deacetylase (PgdA/CDA1 family)